MTYVMLTMATYVATIVIVHGDIFEPMRDYFEKHSAFLAALTSCELCTSIWAGAGVGLLSGHLNPTIWLALSGGAYLIIAIMDLLESMVEYVRELLNARI